MPIQLLRAGDLILLGHGYATRKVRVTSWRENASGTGYDVFVVDENGNHERHGYMARDPNHHKLVVLDRPDPQTWDGTRIVPRPSSPDAKGGA